MANIIEVHLIWNANGMGNLLKAIAESLQKGNERMQIDLEISLVKKEKTS